MDAEEKAMKTRQPERPLDFRHGRIDMTHGSGGRAMARLIGQLFSRAFDNPALAENNDQARLTLPEPGAQLAFSSDSFVVSPLFFPGGDIGSLAVHGTVNDISMSGAKPLWLSAGFILEEGFPLADLERIVHSMAEAARRCGVAIVTGDTNPSSPPIGAPHANLTILAANFRGSAPSRSPTPIVVP